MVNSQSPELTAERHQRSADQDVVESSASAVPSGIDTRVPLSSVVVALYVVGLVILTIRLISGLRKAHDIRGASEPIDDAPLCKLVQRIASRLRLKTVPDVRWCDDVMVPAMIAIGFLPIGDGLTMALKN